MNKKVSILGSTGSIGTQALEVCEKHHMDIVALAAHSSIDMLEKQARKYSPQYVAVFSEDKYAELKERLADTAVTVLCGMEGLCKIAALEENDIVLNSVVGMVGLLPTLTAIKAGKDVALANKETLVAGGSLVMSLAEEKGVNIYPVDSEHSAIFQCLQGNDREQLHKVILTASGGPFYGYSYEQLKGVTKADALKHPNWDMGNKITIDSATLMNKGLEFIEAKWLFGLEPEQIEIVVHRQSVVHSAVEYNDYSIIAQLGVPDMKIPIQYALLYPDRMRCPTKPLSLTDYGTLTFGKPDIETFKCLGAAIEAIKRGGAYPCLINSANEEAVKAFLNDEISFIQIGEIVSSVLDKFAFSEIESYDDVIISDKIAREYVRKLI
ncbi:1-deoxy-D-xylulose-5-phosphate reductoisomerase [Ruminococcus sp. XPD3002]|uniref:1-deoxy-D-xylulose-5-phosphate reductoisomerase n=1 Tax=Ruminococcus sp. XPD3002 TaxID=1452269 RepID=UPI000922FF7E|nr:1-deoxy-D-xylulose 5-phosphate reductoisomerase [Ruminococcus flavefaciens]HRU95909.1 1-deoxy-D-xylulose-5-phosphate reductoisomerase [Ruminococcus sp.]